MTEFCDLMYVKLKVICKIFCLDLMDDYLLWSILLFNLITSNCWKNHGKQVIFQNNHNF